MTPGFPSAEGLPARRLRICIVTFELVGLWKNGGIGTVSTGLAELLAKAGHEVTVAYTRADLLDPESFAAAAARYTAQGIRVVPLRRDNRPATFGRLDGFTGWERFAAFDFLAGEDFDVVHASEHLGELFYCIAAKRLGLHFRNTRFWVGCHGASNWVIEANEDTVRDAFWLWTDATERFCLAHADMVWAPSHYLLGWYAANGYAMPEGRVFQQQYMIPDDLGDLRPPPGTPRGIRRPVTELVFFGRLEPRKGIKLFLAALAELGDELAGISVTFMGRVGMVDGEPADAFIARHAAPLGLTWRILSEFDRFEAYQYVRQEGRMVVAAAPVDNSPCAVYELLEVGAHFLACRGGGVPELVAPDWHAEVLFDYTVAAITERLRHCLRHGSVSPAPSMERSRSEAAWLGVHLALTADQPEAILEVPAQPVLAVVQFEGDAASLDMTLAALAASGGAVGRILLVHSDRRGVLPEGAAPGVERLNLDLLGMAGVIRRLAAEGAPVLLLRAGAKPLPGAVARLAAAARQAEAVVPLTQLEIGGVARVELALPGCEAWGHMYGTARCGGLFSAAGLAALPPADFAGSDILLLFDHALAEGLAVLPLAEALLDGQQLDQARHYVADERARLTLWLHKAPPAKRLMLEAAYGLIVRSLPAPPPAPSPALQELDPPADPAALAHYQGLLASRSFRFGRALTGLVRPSADLPAAPATARELAEAERLLTRSMAWECGAPLRLLARLTRKTGP